MRTFLLFVASLATMAHVAPATDIAHTISTQPNVIVLFMRPECPYCKFIDPIFNAIATRYGSSIRCVKINVNENPSAKDTYNFSSVPTVIYNKDGQEKLRHGSNNKTVTQEYMEQNIKTIYGQ